MNILKKIGIGILVFLIVLYLLFLIVPMFLTGLVNSYAPEISKIVQETCGFKLHLKDIRIITTPKFTAGIKVGHIDINLPTDETFFSIDNAQGKLSLLPLIAKKIEIDKISGENIITTLKVQKDGKFLLENYLPEVDATETSTQQTKSAMELPWGIKLSNHLPDIVADKYEISFVDMATSKIYKISGNNFKIKDFILDKSLNLQADGALTLDNRNQFNYDVKILNKIMPDINLHDLVFNPAPANSTLDTQSTVMINVVDIFKALYDNQLTANLTTDLKVFGTVNSPYFSGEARVDNLGIAVDGKKLPDSSIDLNFKGNKINLDTKLYSTQEDITQILGNFTTGKRPKIDMTFKSNASINGLLAIIDSVAKSLNFNDLDTLSATGKMDADFTLKSNLKKVHSSGYFKLPSASINYPLYNIAIDNINADVSFDKNMVDIKNAGFSILNQPLKAYGTIKSDATSDLHLIADKLQIKGLVAAAGQVNLLKENDFNSGTISLDAALKGRLDKPQPKINVSVDNVFIKNKPTDTSVSLVNSTVDIKTDGKTAGGKIVANQVRVINPLAALSLPVANIELGSKDIVISNTHLLLDNSKIDIAGKVADYMTKKINFDVKATGNIVANDIRNMIPPEMRSLTRASGQMPLTITLNGDAKTQQIDVKLNANPTNYLSILEVDLLKGKNMTAQGTVKLSGNTVKLVDTAILSAGVPLVSVAGSVDNIYSQPKLGINILTNKPLGIVIPGFDKSKMSLSGNINVGGTITHPTLSGNFKIPSIRIPEMLFELNGLDASLAGSIANGKGTVESLKSGGILAQNLSADFSLKNYNTLYLKNIIGEAFSGKVNGEVIYDIAKNSADVDFHGQGLDALKAVEGAVGIKNALSGTLGFDADVALNLANETEMMRSLKGKVSFDIKDGAFLNIGRLETFLFADNIKSNSIMGAALNSIVALPTIKNTANFKSITGNLSFDNGWANLNSIKTSGPSMSYFITGRYNLLNATANLTILGRLGSDIVALLGPVGELSVDKLTAFIPKFGSLTSAVIKTMTTKPQGEKISEIPALSSGNTNYKDFKVSFNGGVESSSSVKSFKWLSDCDTSAIDATTVKEQVQMTKEALQNAAQNKVQQVQNRIDEIKKQNEQTRQQLNDLKNGFKTLFNTSQ